MIIYNINFLIEVINMDKYTFAQEAIQKRIIEKKEWQEAFQDYSEHTDYEAYTDYNDCHGDYYDYQ